MKKKKINKLNKHYFPHLEFLPKTGKYAQAVKLKINL